jgi:hypothetical protein
MEPQEFELYDLANDPGETQNLFGQPQYQTLQSELRDRLQKLQAKIPERKAASTT